LFDETGYTLKKRDEDKAAFDAALEEAQKTQTFYG
jgi:hypothetical protein